ncbi:hypothetical protein BC332_29709 [Capsicum chinense]|nr:hypothetical protein BC332_29709 [Capsicum chinense]
MPQNNWSSPLTTECPGSYCGGVRPEVPVPAGMNIGPPFGIPKMIITDNAANLNSHLMQELYQRRMALAYNKKVCPRNFEVGQLVLRRILPHQVKAKGKFSPNWQGPFVVKKVLPNGALYLTDTEGKMVEIAINADAVKRYYDPPEKWDFPYVQDLPEKWESTLCSGPS